VNLERASRNIAGVTLVPPTGLEPYDLLRHEHVMLSREAVAKLSRSLSATRPETPVQIEPAAAPAKKASLEKSAETKASAKPAVKAESAQKPAKKPAAKKEEKSKAKPKAKKD
ncbi:MAG: 50S ribosomal protein L4, partial [Candidatus Acidiferrales bacterium]